MSIASEITDLQTNLQAAKTAVTTKGGTVSDTGLAGLASEIASIPSGGGPLASYGTITYLDSNDEEQTINITTEDDFLELCKPGASSIELYFGNITITKADVRVVNVADGVTTIGDSFCTAYPNLVSLSIPASVTFIGASFCSGTPISALSTLDLSGVKYVGNYFCYNNSGTKALNVPINLPSVDYVGDYFLQGCSDFNNTVSLNDGCRYIGTLFMSGCSSFTQSFTVPASLESFQTYQNPGNSFMYNCSNFTGPLVCNCPCYFQNDSNTLACSSSSAAMYTTGITLAGPYAQNWKNTIPNNTSRPYRKLIVGS